MTKIFVFGTIAIVLQNLVVDFLGPKRMIIQLAQYLSKIRVYPGKLFLDVCQVRWYEKKNCRNFFSLERLPSFLQNFCFQQPPRCYRHDLKKSPVIVRGLLDPYNLPLRFVTLDSGRKKTPKLFFNGSVTFRFKKLCFQQHLRCYRNGLVTSTVNVKTPSGLL